jgi:hypothetical protein
MLAFTLLTALLAVDDKAVKIDAEIIAAMKKKVAGKITVDKKTGTLQLAYDFRLPRQGSDFLIKEKPADVKGGFVLKPTTSAEHVVPSQTVQVEAKVQIVKMVGVVMKSEKSKVTLSLGGDNLNTLYLEIPNRRPTKQIVVPYTQITGLRTIRFELMEESTLVAYDSYQVTEPTKVGAAGKIEFFGGDYGHAFRSVVFRGKPDPTWLKELSEK